MQHDLSQFLTSLVSANLARVLQLNALQVPEQPVEQQEAQPAGMTREERNRLVLSLLDEVTPVIRKYASAYCLDFEETYQDMSIALIRRLDAGVKDIQSLGALATTIVKRRIIHKLDYTRRRRDRTVSLDAPIGNEEDSATLADFLPNSQATEPLTVLITQERLQELSPIFAQRMNPSRRRAIRERWETAAASLDVMD